VKIEKNAPSKSVLRRLANSNLHLRSFCARNSIAVALLSAGLGVATDPSSAQLPAESDTLQQQRLLKEMELKQALQLKEMELKQAEALKNKELAETRGLKAEELKQTTTLKNMELRQTFWLGISDVILKILGGVFVALAAFTGWRTYQVSQEGQITDRFNKAMENLGKEDTQFVTSRIGSVHALERIAKDSAYDHWTVMEVLTGWIRQRYTWVGQAHHEVDLPPVDIQAALTALGRREYRRERTDQHLDLHQTDLRGFNLIHAKMQRANFSGAHLEFANLESADLSSANLKGTKLNNARTNNQTNVTNAVYNADTEWPAGFNAQARGAILQNN
jgi:hypothetical protein